MVSEVWATITSTHTAAYTSKHEAMTQCCFDVGPTSKPAGQHQNSIVSMPRVCYTTIYPKASPKSGCATNYNHQIQINYTKHNKQTIISKFKLVYIIILSLAFLFCSCNVSSANIYITHLTISGYVNMNIQVNLNISRDVCIIIYSLSDLIIL